MNIGKFDGNRVVTVGSTTVDRGVRYSRNAARVEVAGAKAALRINAEALSQRIKSAYLK